MSVTDNPMFTGVAGVALGVAGTFLNGLFQGRRDRRVTLQSSVDLRIDALFKGYENRITSLTGEVTDLTLEVHGLQGKICKLVAKLEEYEEKCHQCNLSTVVRDIRSLANQATGALNSSRLDQIEQAPSLE